MRITIDIDDAADGTTGATRVSGPTGSTTGRESAPAPADLLARADAVGAISAGPAPTAPDTTGAPPFVPEPGTTSTPTVDSATLTPDATDAQSAGSAPGYDGASA